MASAAAIAIALDIVHKGVDWSSRWGGICPRCGGKRCKVTRTMPREGDVQLRHHRCAKCDLRFKSLQVLEGE